MYKELNTARRLSDKGKKRAALGLLLKEAGIDPVSIRGYSHAVWELEVVVRRHCAAEHGLAHGQKVILDGQEKTVRAIDTAGYILLEGVRGAFHPFRFM